MAIPTLISSVWLAPKVIEKAKDYAAEDADITYRLYKKFNKSLKEEKMINIYENFEKPMIKILAYMEIEGIKIDHRFLKVLTITPLNGARTCVNGIEIKERTLLHNGDRLLWGSNHFFRINCPQSGVGPNLRESTGLLSEEET